MIRAEQGKVIQDTNIFVVNRIRTLEIDFYSSWYLAFGNQALVIAGFVMESFSQVVPPLGSTYRDVIANGYWISCIITFCTASHCAIVSIFSYVYGNGLALRGPAGSVVKAVDGMAGDRVEIFATYGMGVIGLVVSTVFSYFIVMEDHVALACSLINLLGCLYTYKCECVHFQKTTMYLWRPKRFH